MLFRSDTAKFYTISRRTCDLARAARNWILFASLWISATAAVLAIAVSHVVLGAPASPQLVALIFCGTLSLYNLDRLRDLARDVQTSPKRTRFVRQNFFGLTLLAIGAGCISAVLALGFGKNILSVCTGVFVLGLLHLRWKQNPYCKSAYLALAWLLVVVALPVIVYIHHPNGHARLLIPTVPFPIIKIIFCVAILGPALFANAIVFGEYAPNARNTPFGVAKTMTLVGVLVALVAPHPLRWFVFVPLATLLAAIEFRSDEYYPLLVVDGALLGSAALIATFASL